MKVKTKSKKVNKAWLADHVNDPYVKLAQREGYRARAAYKLIELDEKFGLLKGASRVVDLGIAPGGWAQVVVGNPPFGRLRLEPLREAEAHYLAMLRPYARMEVVELTEGKGAPKGTLDDMYKQYYPELAAKPELQKSVGALAHRSRSFSASTPRAPRPRSGRPPS